MAAIFCLQCGKFDIHFHHLSNEFVEIVLVLEDVLLCKNLRSNTIISSPLGSH